MLTGSSDSQSWVSGKGSEFCAGRSVSALMTPCGSLSSLIWPVGTHPTHHGGYGHHLGHRPKLVISTKALCRC